MHAHDRKPLRGKTALITGAARRLGRASALALAGAGADVAITFRNSGRDARETVVDLCGLGVRAFALQCDITDEGSVRAMMKEAGRELGRIDILVNNAANYETAEFEKLTVRQWDAIPVQLSEIHSFQNSGSAPLEMMVIGISRDSSKKIDVVDPASLPGRGRN